MKYHFTADMPADLLKKNFMCKKQNASKDMPNKRGTSIKIICVILKYSGDVKSYLNNQH